MEVGRQMAERLASWLEFGKPFNLIWCHMNLCAAHRGRRSLCGVQVHMAAGCSFVRTGESCVCNTSKLLFRGKKS